MDFRQDISEGHYLVRRVGEQLVQVGERVFSHSFLLSPHQHVDEFPVRELESFDEAAVDIVLELQPVLVLVGTGPRQRMLPPRLQAAFLQRGIGVEAMNNAAAARTFNLLASEGRRVVAVFLI